MEQDVRPKLISGIAHWSLFPEMFVVGHAELDRYIRVPAQSLQPVWRAMQYCDGSRTLDEIGRLVQADGWNLDVAGLCLTLADAGLMEGRIYVSDVDRISVTWLEVRIGRLFPKGRCWKPLVQMLGLAVLLSVVSAGAIWLAGSPNRVGAWNPSERDLAIAVISGAVISTVVHEAGHGLAACAEGLRPGRITVLGYLGVIPYVMLRIPGLYTIRPAARVRVWLAGPLASLGLASLCYVGSGWAPVPLAARAWMDHMSQVNAMIAVWNCCPLLPTDGYFVACTLLRQPNWRIRSWRALTGCIRLRRRPQLLLLMYGFCSSMAMGILTVGSMRRILSFTKSSWLGYFAVLLLILMFGFKRAALKRQRVIKSLGGI